MSALKRWLIAFPVVLVVCCFGIARDLVRELRETR